MIQRTVTICRVCDAGNLFPYLDLGPQPLANALCLTKPDAVTAPRVPLILQACTQCGLSQLTHVVEPHALFAPGYVYHSGISPAWHAHCQALVDEIVKAGDFLIDIGSNDGTLLAKASAQQAIVLGVDPAGSGDEPCLAASWGSAVVREHELSAHVIVAQNVIGHVDDVQDFMEGVRQALRPNGTFVLEAPYLPYLMAHTAFDTVYHEHLSYWTLKALGVLLQTHGLKATGIRFFPHLHGGTVRIYAQHGGHHAAVMEDTMLLQDPATYTAFAASVQDTIEMLEWELRGEPFVGFSAPAKATVMLNALRTRYPSMVYDDTPSKWGKWIPGIGVEIQAPTDFKGHDRLVLYAWNWAEALKARARGLGFRGQFFIPLPRPHWE